MKEKEPKQSFLTWEATAIILASVGFGAILGSREARLWVGKELWLYYRGFKNVIKRGQDKKQAAELELKARRVLTQVFPHGLRVEK